jgi:hypothetical protein
MSTVAQKLGINSGSSVGVAGLTVGEASELVGELPNGVNLRLRDGSLVDQLILAAHSLSDLEAMLPHSWEEIAPSGRLWVWYRKGVKSQGSGARLHRDTLQTLLAQHGMDGVTLISVNDTWSSMRVKQVAETHV